MLRFFLSIILSIYSIFCFAQTEQPEVITNFESNIVVNKNATLNITEKITVYTSLQTLKHGIVRKLPTLYQDSEGKVHHVIYKIDQVLKNNQSTPFYLNKKNHHLLVTMGDTNVLLMPGVYTFTLKYRVQDSISFLNRVDQLNWNVTGNEWEFPILHASLQIELPKEAIIIRYSGYTGVLGAKEQHYKVEQLADNKLLYTLLRSLTLGESFAVSVTWNKGIVTAPNWFEAFTNDVLQKNAKKMVITIFFLLLAYYVFIWYRGKPQRFSTQIPVFSPPKNLSPSILRFIDRMQFDLRTLSIAIISIATKGYLKIQRENNNLILTKENHDTHDLDRVEKKLGKMIFAKDTIFVLSRKNYKTLRKMKIELFNYLKKYYYTPYFVTNFIYFIPGILLGLFAFLIAIFSSPDHSAAFFAIVWLTGWSAACFAFINRFINQLKLIRTHFSFRLLIKVFVSLVCCISFILVDLLGLFIFSKSINVMIVLVLFGILIMNFIFYCLLKIPTKDALELIQQIDGFKLFLQNPNQYQLNELNHLDLTHLFEKYLPYAIALDVETDWINDNVVNLNNELTEALTSALYPTLVHSKKIKDLPSPEVAKQTETLD